MASSIAVGQKIEKKARGRPATGVAPKVSLRFQPEELAAIEAYRAAKDGASSFSDAVRELVAAGLVSQSKATRKVKR